MHFCGNTWWSKGCARKRTVTPVALPMPSSSVAVAVVAVCAIRALAWAHKLEPLCAAA